MVYTKHPLGLPIRICSSTWTVMSVHWRWAIHTYTLLIHCMTLSVCRYATPKLTYVALCSSVLYTHQYSFAIWCTLMIHWMDTYTYTYCIRFDWCNIASDICQLPKYYGNNMVGLLGTKLVHQTVCTHLLLLYSYHQKPIEFCVVGCIPGFVKVRGH